MEEKNVLLQEQINGKARWKKALYIKELQNKFCDVIVEGSTGKGNWAEIPWICFFDVHTHAASNGLYTIILFNNADKSKITLAIGVAAIASNKTFKTDEQSYNRRLQLFENLIDKWEFVENNLDFLGKGKSARDYAKNTITYKQFSYPLNEEILFQNVTTFIKNSKHLNSRFNYWAAMHVSNNYDKFQKLNELKKPKRKETNTSSFIRSEEVKKFVLEREKGTCALCQKKGPFKNTLLGEKYHFLEVAHIEALKEGGYDNPSNAAGLCPNCHRMIDHWENKRSVENYKNRLIKYVKEKNGKLK